MKLSILLISTFLVAATIGALGMNGPPKAPVHETEDEYFGTKIKDPYRWMENIKQDPEVQQWLKAQADFTRQTLDSMPGYAKLKARIAELINSEAGDNLAAASAGERESFLLENGRRSKYSQTLLSERSVRR
jgi:protease II